MWEVEDWSVEMISSKEQKKKNQNKWTELKEDIDYHQACQRRHNGSPRKKEREMSRKNIWRNNGCQIPKLDEIYGSKYPWSSTNTK